MIYRCCMCPQLGSTSKICPAAPVLHPEETPCRFVKEYRSLDGCQYKVAPLSEAADPIYGIVYRKEPQHDAKEWHLFPHIPPSQNFDKVQEQLNHLAMEKEWDRYEEDQPSKEGEVK